LCNEAFDDREIESIVQLHDVCRERSFRDRVKASVCKDRLLNYAVDIALLKIDIVFVLSLA
jgi:hypothetical protein